jgi:hypothetical protein
MTIGSCVISSTEPALNVILQACLGQSTHGLQSVLMPFIGPYEAANQYFMRLKCY